MGTIAGRGKGSNPLPFDAIPREMATDPRLDRAKKDYFVAGRLLFYARWDDHTTVADDTIASESGIGLATVKRSLRRLEAAGWIRRRQARKTRENATGRVIVLCWKLPDFEETRKALADGTSAGPISEGVAHPCAKESRTGDRLESLTGARQLRVVVVEGVENSIPPQAPHPNDNDPDPGPTVIPLAHEEGEARALVEDLVEALAGPVEAIEPADEDAAAAEPVPRVYPMVGANPAHVPPDWAEAMLLNSTTPHPVPPTLARRAAPAKTENISDLTPGQVEWLATLPPEQRTTFDGLSPGRKAMVLGRRPHGACTDPLLLRMEAADLAPRRAVAAFKPVLTIEDAVEAIVGGYRPATAMLATLLAREFDDQKSWPFFDQVGALLLAYPAQAGDFLDALRQARNPKAVNPGAVLVTVLRRDYGW